MHPEVFLGVLLVLAVAAIPFVLLGLLISIRGRQARDHEEQREVVQPPQEQYDVVLM